MVELFPATPLPEGCEEKVVKDEQGLGYKVTVFPDGSEMDSALAPFWRQYHPEPDKFNG